MKLFRLFALVSVLVLLGLDQSQGAAGIQESNLTQVSTANLLDLVRLTLKSTSGNSRQMTLSNLVTWLSTNGIANTNLTTVLSNNITSNIATNNTNVINRPWLVIEGDSMTTDGLKFGDSVPTGAGNDWPTQLKAQSNFKNFGLYTNYAQNGAVASGMAGEYPTQGQTKRPSNTNFANAYYFLWAGVNDLRNSNSAGSIYGTLTNLWWLARKDGFSTVAMTIPNFSGANGSNATVEAIRSSLNTLIKGDRQQYDFLIDVDALFPDLTTKFDGLHLSTAGNLTLAQWINTNLVPVKPMYPMFGGNHWGRATFIGNASDPYTYGIFRTARAAEDAGVEIGDRFVGSYGGFDLNLQSATGFVGVGLNGVGISHALEVNGTVAAVNSGNLLASSGGVYVAGDISGNAIRANTLKLTNSPTFASSPLLKGVLVSDVNGVGTWALPYALQEVRSVSNALFTGSSVAVFDDTTLSLAETTNVLSVTITPLRSDTFIIVEAVVNFGITTSAKVAAGIFRDANAAATSVSYCSAGGIWSNQIKLYTKFPSTATSSTQFNVRLGSDAGTYYVNGLAGARVFGGTSESWIVAREVSQ